MPLLLPTRRRFASWAAMAAAVGASGLPGCGYLPRAATVPMPTIRFDSPCASRARALLVVLPGRGMTMREMNAEGFVAAVHAAGLAVDVLLVDAHVGYYQDRSIVDRLRIDVVEPAMAAGRPSIWLAGISLGGLGALLYADAHSGDIAGVLTLAPYLGEPRAVPTSLREAGLRNWQAPQEVQVTKADDEDVGLKAWRIAQRFVRADPPSTRPPLYLGFGLSDRFAPAEQVLAEALPPARVFTAAGGHDWNPWLGLWQRMLAASDLPRCRA
ncbi:alpha/beta hydrolase [Variovorax sp. KK3]|uniref:alpha/beta hydrolase n=2 Tax=Variovorax sp. KK3 TaxID=1855728 RepID=UPI003AAB7EDB